MVDLLQNKKSSQTFPKERKNKSNLVEEKSENSEKNDIRAKKPVNINKFRDPEDLTVKKMEIGLWILENRGHFVFLLTLLFATISIVTWSIFAFTFGNYVLRGMKQDKMLSSDLLNSMVVGHDYYIQRAPQKLQYGKVKVLNNLDEVYDFVISVKNVNPNYWVEIDYSITSGSEEFGRSSSFILPNEEKDLLVLGEEFEKSPGGVELKIKEERWHRVDNHQYPDWKKFHDSHLSVPVKEVSFTPANKTILTEKVDLNTLSFVVLNDSAYNYWEVGFIIKIYNGNKIVAADKYVLNQFMSDQKREIDITWPGDFGRVTDISVTPELNITRDDIYIEFDVDSIKNKNE